MDPVVTDLNSFLYMVWMVDATKILANTYYIPFRYLYAPIITKMKQCGCVFRHRLDRRRFESHNEIVLSVKENTVINPHHSGCAYSNAVLATFLVVGKCIYAWVRQPGRLRRLCHMWDSPGVNHPKAPLSL